MLLIMFMFVIGFMFIFTAGNQLNEFDTRNKVELVRDFGENLKNQLDQASIIEEGFRREIVLPERIDDKIDYSISMRNSSIIIDTDVFDYSAVIPDVIGELEKGLNIVKNKKGFVLILNEHYEQKRVGQWKFDEGNGLSTDDEVLANQGNLTGTTWVSGKFGNGIWFDGIGDYVEIPHNNAYLLENGTVSLWFYPTRLGTDQALFSKDSSGFDAGGHLTFWVMNDASVEVRIQSPAASFFATSPPGIVTENNWHFISVSFGEGGVELRLDGITVGKNAYTGGTSSGGGNYEPIAIGVGTVGSGDLSVLPFENPFEGMIDNVHIYSKSLTKAEVYDIFLE